MYRKILIATDGSSLAENAVHHGLLLAKTVGATVLIVTVTEMWSALEMSSEEAMGRSHPVETYERLESERASSILAAAAEQAKGHGVACETRHVADATPSDGILTAAQDSGCDLIVMATHGRRGVNRMILGSQTNRVVVQSQIPVLVVR